MVMDVLSRAPPARVQKDLLHGQLNRRVLTKQRPKWDDTSRGMFIALLRQSTRTLPSRTFPVECTIDGLRTIDVAVFKTIAEMMKARDGFAGFNELMALEKWAWLCTMYAKSKAVNKALVAVGGTQPLVWRYANSMGFLGEDPATTQPFVDLITSETFVILCVSYEANDNDQAVIKAFSLLENGGPAGKRKSSRRSLDSVVSAIKTEMVDEPPAKVACVVAATPQLQQLQPSTSSTTPMTPTDMNGSAAGAGERRMTTRASARTAGRGSATVEVKTEPKEEAEIEEKIERPERAEEEPEVDFTGSTANGPTWTKEMVDQVVQEVRKRQSFWDQSHPDYRSITKRRDAMSAIAHSINVTHGTTLTDKDLTNKWNHMRGAFGKIVDMYSASPERPRSGHFYEQMSFLLTSAQNQRASPLCSAREGRIEGAELRALAASLDTVRTTPSPTSSGGGSETQQRNTTPTVTVTEGPSQPLNLHELLRGISSDANTKTTLKHFLDAGFLTPQPGAAAAAAAPAAGTPVQSPSAAYQAAAAAAVAAASAAVNASSNGLGHGSGVVSRPAPFNTAPQQKEAQRMDREIATIARNSADSWNIFGRLVESSGRELNRVDPALAIRMQRALHQVLYDFRLVGANSGYQF